MPSSENTDVCNSAKSAALWILHDEQSGCIFMARSAKYTIYSPTTNDQIGGSVGSPYYALPLSAWRHGRTRVFGRALAMRKPAQPQSRAQEPQCPTLELVPLALDSPLSILGGGPADGG